MARNARLRTALDDVAASLDVDLYVPPPELCTDNGAMIAWAGAEHYARGRSDGWDVPARARWPLDGASQAVYGSGKHGAKA